MFRALLIAASLCSWSILSECARGIAYLALGNAFYSAAIVARMGSMVFPGSLGMECALICHSCQVGAKQMMRSIVKTLPASPYTSWQQNQHRLAQIPVASCEDQQLIRFLQDHWLSKQSGFYSFIVDWVCPCFDVPLQVHPATSSAYARDPASLMSDAYVRRLQRGKGRLPQPKSFPLLLTRPCDIRPYLPSYVEALPGESPEALLARGAGKILDVTDRFADWRFADWEEFRQQLLSACKSHNIDSSQLICMQRVQNEEVVGIRLLPLVSEGGQDVLQWISEFGLSAARVELEGMPQQKQKVLKKSFKAKPLPFVYSGVCDHPQKKLFIDATLHVLNGLFDAISEDLWTSIASCPVRSSIIDMSITNIREEFEKIAQEKQSSFFHTASHMEEIHAHLSSILAICRPFVLEDFAPIYSACMKRIPPSLKLLVSCGIHSSGMASFAGILKAAETTSGHKLCVLYGENTYFECINTIKRMADAYLISEATEDRWRRVDLIVAQFNPALKRPSLYQQGLAHHYQVEPIAAVVRRALSVRKDAPLTVALDCTFDFLDSERVARLLEEFQKEIMSGILNVVCYRSGLKFDLLGMDNHAGAPFASFHQGDAWVYFDAMLKDPALQIDPLSLQWFCLAYAYAASQLDLYRKQIFENTRAILDRVPATLYAPDAKYRIIPMEKEVDPGFIDFKVFGPFHNVRAAVVGCGFLLCHCLEQGHPIFSRRSVGYYHPNFNILFSEQCATMRFTIGMDPAQIDIFVDFFKQMALLNSHTN